MRRRTINPSDINYIFDWVLPVALLSSISAIMDDGRSHCGLRASYDTANVSCGSCCVVSMSRVTASACTMVERSFKQRGASPCMRKYTVRIMPHGLGVNGQVVRLMFICMSLDGWKDSPAACAGRSYARLTVDPDSPRPVRADSATHPLLEQTTTMYLTVTPRRSAVCKFQ